MTTQIEERLLSAAVDGDLQTITGVVSNLSIKDKESISSNASNAFDFVLDSIVRNKKVNAAEKAYTILVFVREVGRYTSQAALVNAMIQSAPPIPYQGQKKVPDIQLQQVC